MMVMSNKSFIPAISISLIFILAVGGALVIEAAKANPVLWPSTPNQDKPTLTIGSPENNTAYNEPDVYLNFTVTKPDSWIRDGKFPPLYNGEVASVSAHLDGNDVNLTSNFHGGPFEMDLPYSAKLNLSASRVYMLNVTVISYIYYMGPVYNGSLLYYQSSSNPVYKYPIIVSDKINFTLDQPTQSPNPQQLTVEFPTWIILPIVIVVAAMLVAVLNKKRTSKPHIS